MAIKNNRIDYAIQQIVLGNSSAKKAMTGVQSVGVTTNFNLEQVFELGQLAIYQNIEGIPEIEVTISKVLDGKDLLYTSATERGTALGATYVATSPDLAGRQNARVDVELSIFRDNLLSASGSPFSSMVCSGMYVSSVSYTFPVDGNFTEDVTLVGNDKIWQASGVGMTGAFTQNNDEPIMSAGGVGRRQYLDMNLCVFPEEIPGIASGTGRNTLIGGGSGHNTHFQNITVSCDLGRETILELGTLAPYHRYVTFPIEVTSEFEVIATSGDGINATESGYWKGDPSYGASVQVATASDTGCTNPRFNLRDQKILLKTCEGTTIGLGQKNKLTSVNYTGGDTGGGNVTITYSYSNFNDFSVAHPSGAVGGGWVVAVS